MSSLKININYFINMMKVHANLTCMPNESDLLNFDYNFERMSRALDVVKLYIYQKHEITYKAIPTRVEGIISILFRLAVSYNQLISNHDCMQCAKQKGVNECPSIIISCAYIVSLFWLAYSNHDKADLINLLDEVVSPDDIDDIFNQIKLQLMVNDAFDTIHLN